METITFENPVAGDVRSFNDVYKVVAHVDGTEIHYDDMVSLIGDNLRAQSYEIFYDGGSALLNKEWFPTNAQSY